MWLTDQAEMGENWIPYVDDAIVILKHMQWGHTSPLRAALCVRAWSVFRGTGRGSNGEYKQLRVQTAGGKSDHL